MGAGRLLFVVDEVGGRIDDEADEAPRVASAGFMKKSIAFALPSTPHIMNNASLVPCKLLVLCKSDSSSSAGTALEISTIMIDAKITAR